MSSPVRRFSRAFRVFTFVLICLWAAAPVLAKPNTSPTPVPTPMGTPSPDYPKMVIGPGDLLAIVVLGYDRSLGAGGTVSTLGVSAPASPGVATNAGLPANYLVDTDGRINFPYVGPVNLAGLTQIEASQLLIKKLGEYLKFPQVTVMIQTSNTYNVSVLGDLFHPGQFMIRGRPDVLSMIAQAGGAALNPDLGSVLITRGTIKIHVDVGRYLSDPNYHATAPIVYPGDIIYVPQNPWPTLSEIAVFVGVIYTAYVVANDLKK